MRGIKTGLTLFNDATFNPMVQAGIGQMLIGHFDTAEDKPHFPWFFYSNLATGFEINFFDSFKMLVLSGYRLAPHRQIIGIQNNAFSSTFSAVSFRVVFD